jgi:branched-chain amino acid transport system substrate-binding protein
MKRRGLHPAIARSSAIAIVVIIVLAVVIGLAYYASLPPPLKGTIKIGLMTSLTGAGSASGLDQQRAASLAVEEINAAGGIFLSKEGGRFNLTLDVADDQSSTSGGVAAMTKLVVQDQVDIVIGALGSAFALAALPVVIENKVPYIATPSTPQLTRSANYSADPSKYMVFHYQATGLQYGAAIADFLAQVVRPAVAPDRQLKVAWLYQDSAFGRDFFTGYTQRVAEKGYPLALVASEKFKIGSTDFRAVLTQIKAAGPDVLIPMGFTSETVNMIKQAVTDVGIRAQIGPICACADDPSFYKSVGPQGDGVTIISLYATYAIPKGEQFRKWQDLRQKFLTRYNTLPGLLGVSAYDAVYIAARAFEAAGTRDKAAVIQALQSLKIGQLTLPVQGGTLSFDPVYREVQWLLFAQQFYWNATLGEVRAKVIWPSDVAEASFTPIP